MVNGTRDHAHALHEQVAQVLAPMGLRLSAAKTRIAHLSEGVDFLGFHLQWRRKRGTGDRWYVYTFIADRPVRQLKDKIRALTPRTSQLNPKDVLIRLNQIMRGWSNYFKHAVAKAVFRKLEDFVWHRVARWLKSLHRWSWKDLRRRLGRHDGTWGPITVDGIALFDLGKVPVSRYRYRGNTIPTPWPKLNNQRQHPWRARCGESRTAGSASGLGKRTDGNIDTAPQADSTHSRMLHEDRPVGGASRRRDRCRP